MRKEPSKELLKFLQKISETKGLEIANAHILAHILMPIICDCCKDERKEAFPYYVDICGRFWDDLCNDCYDSLENEFPEST